MGVEEFPRPASLSPRTNLTCAVSRGSAESCSEHACRFRLVTRDSLRLHPRVDDGHVPGQIAVNLAQRVTTHLFQQRLG